MCDINTGLVADDREIEVMLKKSNKPVVLCVNKCDRVGQPPYEYYEFYELGYDNDPIVLSSLHGTGTGDLLDEVVSYFPAEEEADEDDGRIKVAIIGKPNAGKSSLTNKILGSDRMIVSPIAGTTRDAVDSEVDNQFGKYTLIDTAGIRRQSKVNDRIEKYSVLRAHMAVERADVCILVIDGSEGISEQDEKIAGIAHEAGKPCIIVVNKWDLVEKDNSTYETFKKDIYTSLSYMTYAPMITISAKTGQRVDGLFKMINTVYDNSCLRVPTGRLNDVLREAMERVQPPSDKGKRLKIYYMTQSSACPPTFVIFCNNMELFHFSYQRYIENTLRSIFDFSGTPIKIFIRERGEENQ
jgi:GTP-binding protein